ncbi:MAG: CpaD family pilus assembly lipoprotein [Pseudomonadota bacterium]
MNAKRMTLKSASRLAIGEACRDMSMTCRPLLVIVVAATTLTLTACRDRQHEAMRALAKSDYTIAHPITFSHGHAHLHVEVPHDRRGLSRRQRVDVYRFLQLYRARGEGRLTVSAPRAPRDHMVVSRALRRIKVGLEEIGLRRRALRLRRHATRGYEEPTIRLSFQYPLAQAPRCGAWPDDLGRHKARLPYHDFGCSAQRNLALSVDNARDLQRPRDVAPASAQRRFATWQDYLGTKPEETSAAPKATTPSATPPSP